MGGGAVDDSALVVVAEKVVVGVVVVVVVVVVVLVVSSSCCWKSCWNWSLGPAGEPEEEWEQRPGQPAHGDCSHDHN